MAKLYGIEKNEKEIKEFLFKVSEVI